MVYNVVYIYKTVFTTYKLEIWQSFNCFIYFVHQSTFNSFLAVFLILISVVLCFEYMFSTGSPFQ